MEDLSLFKNIDFLQNCRKPKYNIIFLFYIDILLYFVFGSSKGNEYFELKHIIYRINIPNLKIMKVIDQELINYAVELFKNHIK